MFVMLTYKDLLQDYLLHDRTMLVENIPLAVRASMWHFCDDALAHFNHIVRDVLSNTDSDWWMDRGEPTMSHPCSPDLNPMDFYLLWPQITLLYASPIDNEEVSHHHMWMPVRLSATTPVSLNRYGSPLWEVSIHALSLMEDILSTNYKCTLSVITCKLYVPRHTFICILFFII
jgi:hypothetical protein